MIFDLLTALPVSFRAQTTAQFAQAATVSHISVSRCLASLSEIIAINTALLCRVPVLSFKKLSVTQTISYYTQQQPADAEK